MELHHKQDASEGASSAREGDVTRDAVALKSPPPAPHCARWAATQGLLYFALLRRKWQNFLDMRTCRQRDRVVISARASANRDERGRPFRETTEDIDDDEGDATAAAPAGAAALAEAVARAESAEAERC